MLGRENTTFQSEDGSQRRLRLLLENGRRRQKLTMKDEDGSQYQGCCEEKAASIWKLKMNDGGGRCCCEGEEEEDGR